MVAEHLALVAAFIANRGVLNWARLELHLNSSQARATTPSLQDSVKLKLHSDVDPLEIALNLSSPVALVIVQYR